MGVGVRVPPRALRPPAGDVQHPVDRGPRDLEAHAVEGVERFLERVPVDVRAAIDERSEVRAIVGLQPRLVLEADLAAAEAALQAQIARERGIQRVARALLEAQDAEERGPLGRQYAKRL